MANSPLVSVIMPVYNAGRFLEAAVGSVLRQTFDDFELLIVDDCSSDGAIAALDLSDSRIRIIRNEQNIGAAESRNRALRLARGALVAIHDADDLSLPTRFERAVDLFLAREDLCVVSGGHWYVDESGAPITTTEFDASTAAGKALVPTTHDGIGVVLQTHLPFGHGSVTARRTCMMEAGSYDREFEPAEDYALLAEMFIRGCRFHGIAEPVFTYRVHDAGISKSGAAKLLRSNVVISQRVRDNSTGRPLEDWKNLVRIEPEIERSEPRLLVTKHVIKSIARDRRGAWPIDSLRVAAGSGPTCCRRLTLDGVRSMRRQFVERSLRRLRRRGTPSEGPA